MYLKVNRIDLKSVHHTQKIVTVWSDECYGWTYWGDYFTTYTNIESLCCAPETTIMLHVNGIKKNTHTQIVRASHSLLVIYPREMKTQPHQDSYTFIAALFE